MKRFSNEQIKVFCFYFNWWFFLASENDSKISNISEEDRTKDDSDIVSEPSECKIPKTDLEESQKEAASNEVVENIEVKIVFNKKKYDVSAPANTSIADFKKQLQGLLGSNYLPCKILM